ncbi:MAG: hypothetical protein UW30_C0001G0048 [Candidatus Giovannonibacteria bacterium GW2011_GWA2_44_13b]|uniref:Uncharacterized protein n=1 Tax=Candidatus Giovannonibacteria bacterium GW2011_GWA2_44_13b TaxID=1618647 RepID=A0A0G1H741_9BACT|nr:MAG: hypothetical protein UW30_C0001G0048 [Candidatus Giovannonibacteria bacterium GW2011_GWA2_44_13b]
MKVVNSRFLHGQKGIVRIGVFYCFSFHFNNILLDLVLLYEYAHNPNNLFRNTFDSCTLS